MAVVEQEIVGTLTGLMEIILHVKDMNTQVAFYRDKLGLRVAHPEGVVDFAKQSWVTFDTGRCILALHEGGRIRQGENPSHRIVFQTDNIQTARNKLLDKGVQVGEVRSPAPGVEVIDGRDPEGNVYAIESHK
jgi:catechol 2,3-dioxygenase-like lactoylglutathione lyase family enzyme